MRIADFDVFIKRFSPLEQSEGNLLFETYGEDLEQVRQYENCFIWTLLDCDGKMYIAPGYHIVNRMNYFITKNPWQDGQRDYKY